MATARLLFVCVLALVALSAAQVQEAEKSFGCEEAPENRDHVVQAVRNYYKSVLQRTADDAELDSWVQMVMDGKYTVAEVEQLIGKRVKYCEEDVQCGHGQCIDGHCSCDGGWGGKNCTTRTCPNECSEKGECVDGSCVCNDGWTGADCSEKITAACPNDCSGHGHCHDDGHCECDFGYTGEDCRHARCPDDCSGHGKCVEGKCECSEGYAGANCGDASNVRCKNDCSNHGQCSHGRCYCKEGYSGDDCSVGAVVEMGEIGYVSAVNNNQKTIQFRKEYKNPVVIAQPLSFRGGDPADAHLVSVTKTGFTIRVHEPSTRDDRHASESVPYLVLEAGSYKLADGTTLEAGHVRTSATQGQGVPEGERSWESHGFTALFEKSPVVLSQVQTKNDGQFVTTRHKAVSKTSFEVAMEGTASSTNKHAEETVGYVAVDRTHGVWSGYEFEAGQTGRNVGSSWTHYSYAKCFRHKPKVVGQLASSDNEAAGHIRWNEPQCTNCVLSTRVEDDGRNVQVQEAVNYIAIAGDGMLKAQLA